MASRIHRALAVGAAAASLATGVVASTSFTAPTTEAARAETVRHNHATRAVQRSPKAIRFRNEMRKLWEDHIVWTRQFIVSAIAGLPDTNTAAQRLLANQDHIGNAVKPFYGRAAGEQLSALLRDHIVIAADLVGAAKAGDAGKFEDANRRWNRNARDIADFLASANPRQWSQAEMRSMMARHLRWTLAEASARLNADWDADVAAYERIHRDILHMADMLSLGIIAQFPARF